MLRPFLTRNLPGPPAPSAQAKSYGDGELLDRLEGKARILGLQRALIEQLAAMLGALQQLGGRGGQAGLLGGLPSWVAAAAALGTGLLEEERAAGEGGP